MLGPQPGPTRQMMLPAKCTESQGLLCCAVLQSAGRAVVLVKVM